MKESVRQSGDTSRSYKTNLLIWGTLDSALLGRSKHSQLRKALET